MLIKIASQVTVKLFIGVHLNSEIRMHLNQSKTWKQAIIQPMHANNELIEVHHQSKEFLGFYIDQQTISLAEIKDLENLIRKQLLSFCPDFDISSIEACIFPQEFIA